MPNLLIVAALFAPSRSIGARRPARLAEHLSRRGWSVSVLTPKARYMLPIDPGFEASRAVTVIRTRAPMPGEALRRVSAPLSRLLSGSRARRVTTEGPESGERSPSVRDRPAPARLLAPMLGRMEFPDKWIGWYPFALHATAGLRFDVALATLPPYTPALIARAVARRTGARLVLDYRDPWTEAPRRDWGEVWHEGLRERHRRLEDACLASADLLIGVSPTICRLIASRTDKEVVLVPNSYEVNSSVPRGSDVAGGGPGRIVYAGSLAYGRNLAPLFSAFSVLARDFDPERLRFTYAGPDSAKVAELVESFDLGKYVENLGSIQRAEADALVRRAAAAVVTVSRDYEYQYPAKIFDIVAAGRPILLIAPEASDAADLVSRHGLGWCHPPEDIDGIVRSLRQALAGEIPVPRDLEHLQTDHAVGELDRALRRILGRDDR